MRVKLEGASIDTGVTVLYGASDLTYTGIETIEVTNSCHDATVILEELDGELRVLYHNHISGERKCVLSILP